MKRIIINEISESEFTQLLKSAIREVLAETSNSPNPNNKGSPEDITVLNSKQVCEILHISAPTLITYRKTGKIKAKRISGKLFYLKTEIEKFLAK